MWFLFTARDRARTEFVVEACTSTGGPEPIVVRDDQRNGIGPMMDAILHHYPDEPFYGWLADDTYPQTPRWNLELELAAQPNRIAYPADGGYMAHHDLVSGHYFSSGLCWGGDLVRAAGLWSLGFHSAWLDVAWSEIVRPLNLYRYVPEVVIRHDHWRTGRRSRDELDEAASERVGHDRDRFENWKLTELPAILERVREQSQESLCVS